MQSTVRVVGGMGCTLRTGYSLEACPQEAQAKKEQHVQVVV